MKTTSGDKDWGRRKKTTSGDKDQGRRKKTTSGDKDQGRRRKMTSGDKDFDGRVPKFKYRVTLATLGAGVVCHIYYCQQLKTKGGLLIMMESLDFEVDY